MDYLLENFSYLKKIFISVLVAASFILVYFLSPTNSLAQCGGVFNCCTARDPVTRACIATSAEVPCWGGDYDSCTASNPGSYCSTYYGEGVGNNGCSWNPVNYCCPTSGVPTRNWLDWACVIDPYVPSTTCESTDVGRTVGCGYGVARDTSTFGCNLFDQTTQCVENPFGGCIIGGPYHDVLSSPDCFETTTPCGGVTPPPSPPPPDPTPIPPPPGPPTCSVRGPTLVDLGTSPTYEVTPSDPDGDLTSVEIWVSPTSADSWNNIYTGAGSGSGIYPFPSVGTYYVTCNAYDAADNKCSGNPWCEWEPNPPSKYVCGADGWVNCTFGDLLTITVTPSSGPLACPTNFSVVCGAFGTNTTISWDPISGADRYVLRVNKDPFGDWFNGAGGDQWHEPFSSPFNFSIDPDADYNYDVQGVKPGELYPYAGCRAPFDVFNCPSPVDCDIDIPFVSLNGVGDSATATVTVVDETGGVIKTVDFFSSDPSVVTVSPDIPPGPAFITTLTAQAIGGATYTALATMNDGFTKCQDTAGVSVGNPLGWWQVVEGDIVAGGGIAGGISSEIAGSCDIAFGCDPVLITGDPGVPTFTTSVNPSPPSISSTNWNADSSVAPAAPNYVFFKSKIPSTLTPPPADPGSNPDGLTFETLGSFDGEYYWFQRNGDVTIETGFDLTNRKVILFVNGDLRIRGNIELDDGQGLFLVIVSGDIIVSPTVGGAVRSGPNLEGVYFAQNTFITEGGGDLQLHLRGSVAANSYSLKRGLTDNSQDPAEIFEYGVDQVMLFPDELTRKRLIWREVAP